MLSEIPPLLVAVLRNFGSVRLNRNMIGFTVETRTPPLNAEAFQAFARATRDRTYLNAENFTVAPPLLLAKLTIPMLKSVCYHPDLKMNPLRMVHAGQTLCRHRTLAAGDRVSLTLCVEAIERTAAGDKLSLSGRAYTGDTLAVEGVTELIVRTRKRAKRLKIPKEGRKERFRTDIVTVEGQQIEYAAVSGDRNIIHTHNLAARLAGLPRSIMHGACLLAMYCDALTRATAANDYGRFNSIRGRFRRPVLPGQLLTLVGYDALQAGKIEFDVINPDGQTVFSDGLFAFNPSPLNAG